MPEKCRSVCASPRGAYLFAGGQSGKLYVWELSSGRLLHAWNGHYKAVRNLKMDATGTLLVSGGDDAIVHLWLVPEVLDAEPGVSPRPHYSWSGHTLPVSDMDVMSGGSATKVVSVSMDCTCQMWSVGSATCRAVFQLPSPLLSVVMENARRAVYCGGQNGKVYEISLKPCKGGASRDRPFHGCHEQPVTSLVMTALTQKLVSGSLDGTVRLWDVCSRQCLQVLDMPGKKPVSNVFYIHNPERTLNQTDPSLPSKLLGISKYPGMSLREQTYPWEGPVAPLSHQTQYECIASVFLKPNAQSLEQRLELRGGAPPAKKVRLDASSDKDMEELDLSTADVRSLVSKILNPEAST